MAEQNWRGCATQTRLPPSGTEGGEPQAVQAAGTYLKDGRQRQLWKRNAVGLALQVLQGEIVQLLQQAILCSTRKGQCQGTASGQGSSDHFRPGYQLTL